MILETRQPPPGAETRFRRRRNGAIFLPVVVSLVSACGVDVAGLRNPASVPRDAAAFDSQRAESATPDAWLSPPDAAPVAIKPDGARAGETRSDAAADANKLPEAGSPPFAQDSGQSQDSPENPTDTGGAEGGTERDATEVGEVGGWRDTPQAEPIKLIGESFGTGPPHGNNPAVGFAKAFDGDTNTFVDDDTATGGYVGIDLGPNKTARVLRIRYFPRKGGFGLEARMNDGKFQCSATSKTEGYTDLHTIPAVPPIAWTEVTITDSPSCRYLRYLGPAWGYTNVAEIEFWGL